MSQPIPLKSTRGRPRKTPIDPVETVPKSEPGVPAATVKALAPSTSQQTGGPAEAPIVPPKPAAKKRGRPPKTVIPGPSGEASASTSSKKAKKDTKPAIAQDGQAEVVKPKRKPKEKKEDPNAERYARVQASGCPDKFFNKFKRAISHRMFMIDRHKEGSGIHEQEVFKILGSTGNVYTTRISTQPKCDCPDYLFNGRTICKHTIFVLIRVLKVPDESDVWYRARLNPEELATIFAAAPPHPQDSVASTSVQKAWRQANGLDVEEDEDQPEDAAKGPDAPEVLQKKMEAIGEDCPVCYEEITQDDVEGDKLVSDASPAGCGKPLHKECFDQWVKTAVNKGLPVTCVWCRAPWPVPGVPDPNIDKGKSRMQGQNYAAMGYLNMAEAADMQRPSNVTKHR